MYVVIMAGGGGTRLRPLSTAARPKPFLPLLPTGETLLQRTVARLRGPELDLADADICVVASAAYAPLVRAQVPGIAVVVEPEGRNTAAAIALATLAVDRDDDDVMVVLPADHRIDPEREGVFRGVLRAAADGPGHRGLRRRVAARHAGHPAHAPVHAVRLPGAARGGRRGRARACAPTRWPPSARSRRRRTRRPWWPRPAWPGTRACSCGGGGRSARHSSATRRTSLDGVADGLASGDLAAAYPRLPSRSIDYAVMEPAGAAGEVVMAGLDVGWSDIGTWPALLEVLGAPGVDGGVVEAGETIDATAEDLLVERGPDGLVVREGVGKMIALDPIAHLRGARGARPLVQALLDRCAAAEART